MPFRFLLNPNNFGNHALFTLCTTCLQPALTTCFFLADENDDVATIFYCWNDVLWVFVFCERSILHVDQKLELSWHLLQAPSSTKRRVETPYLFFLFMSL